jgi:hypothetical protein
MFIFSWGDTVQYVIKNFKMYKEMYTNTHPTVANEAFKGIVSQDIDFLNMSLNMFCFQLLNGFYK